MDKSRTDYSILNIATGLGGYAVNTILGLICRMVFTRTLEAEYLGINGLFTNILGMLSLAELGIGSAIVYALYKPLAVNDEKKIASLVKFYGQCYRAVGIFIGAAGLCLLPFLDLLIGKDMKDTKARIEAFKARYDADVQAQVEKRLVGKTPQAGNGGTVSEGAAMRAEIDKYL